MAIKDGIKLFGVPGGGKTTRCLKIIQEMIQNGKRIDEICFTTFTKAGLKSIKEKLTNEGIQLPSDNWFRTLHSLTWKLSGFQSNQIADYKQKAELFQKLKINTSQRDEDLQSEMQDVLELYDKITNNVAKNILKLSESELKDQIYRIQTDDEDFTKVHKYAIAVVEYAKWLKENNKKDFADAMIEVLEQKIDIPCPVLFVDEAQDLNLLQCKLIDLWTKHYDKEFFVIAGDDDQAVHQWRGSQPDYLIEYDSPNMKKEILTKSYRLPEKIASFCNIISREIKTREHKVIEGSEKEAEIKMLYLNSENVNYQLERLLKDEKHCFLLFRTNRELAKFSDSFFAETDIPFGYIGERKGRYWNLEFIMLCNALNKIKAGQDLETPEAKTLFRYLSTDAVEWGNKTAFWRHYRKPTISVDEALNLTRLWKPQRTLKSYFDPEKIKTQMLQYVQYAKGSYREVKTVERNDQYLKKLAKIDIIFPINWIEEEAYVNKRVFLGTYHASKGLESPTVIQFLTTNRYFSEIGDAEKRIFYTGASRTKNKLYFVSSYGMSQSEHSHYLEDYYEPLIKKFAK